MLRDTRARPVEPRFLCDAMLGHLARDLRLLGYDVAYAEPDAADGEVLAAARAEGRLLLTKDRELARRAGPDALLLDAPAPGAETEETLRRLGLRPTRAAFLSRCTRCGGTLSPIRSADVPDLPPAVADRHVEVTRCDACGHVYWQGSHVDAIERRLGRHLR